MPSIHTDGILILCTPWLLKIIVTCFILNNLLITKILQVSHFRAPLPVMLNFFSMNIYWHLFITCKCTRGGGGRHVSRHEVHRAIEIGKTCCIHTGLNIAIGIIAHAVANIPERSLRCYQYREAFIAPFSTENNNILGFKCSLRHWRQIPNLSLASLTKAVCSNKMAADGLVCAVGNKGPNCQQLYEMARNL